MFSEVKLRLSAERLREVLKYAPETGLFYWRVTRGGAIAEMEAGNRNNGYCRIEIDGIQYYAHRLAWLYVHGEHPAEEIDHRNGNPCDNRIENLRPCSRAQNARNISRKRNSSGFKGVCRCGRKWTAQIAVNGRKIYLGLFSSPQKAAEAYDKAARLHHGEFARTNAQTAAQRSGDSPSSRRPASARPHLVLCRPTYVDERPARFERCGKLGALPFPGRFDFGAPNSGAPGVVLPQKVLSFPLKWGVPRGDGARLNGGDPFS